MKCSHLEGVYRIDVRLTSDTSFQRFNCKSSKEEAENLFRKKNQDQSKLSNFQEEYCDEANKQAWQQKEK